MNSVSISSPGRSWQLLPRSGWGKLAMLCGVLVLSALFGLEALAESGGHSLDSTDPMNYDRYALRNDLSTTAYVHLCADNGCARLAQHTDWIELKPGAADQEQVYWGPGASAMYAVASAPNVGAVRGCLLLDANHKTTSAVNAPLSTATPCRG